MRPSSTLQRAALIVSAAAVTTTTAVLAFAGPTSPHTAAALAAGPPVAADCTSQNYAKRRLLPEPPVKDLTRGPSVPAEITMRILRNGSHYCYFLDGLAGPYVDAPTIRVRKDQTWTLRLIDEIAPTPAPAGAATDAAGLHPMAMSTKSPDGCAIMDFDAPLPAPNNPGYLGKARIFAKTPSMPSTDTNLHTHGFHVDPDVDNVFKSLSNSGAPGSTKQCVYTFHFFPSQYVGTYWYHSHMHGIAQAQVGGGLAGTIIVDAAKPPPRLPEHVLLIKDYQAPVFAETNRVAQLKLSAAEGDPGRNTKPAPIASFDPHNPPSWLSGQPITTTEHCPTAGRLVHWTVNGYPLADPVFSLGTPPPATPPPASPPPTLLPPPLSIVRSGERVLYRAINATSESFVNLRLLDASGNVEKLAVVGRDGVPVNGQAGNPEALAAERDNVLLPPGGRADVVVTGQTRPQLLIADMVCSGYLGDWIPRRNIVEIAPNGNVPDPSATATPAAMFAAVNAGAVSTRVARPGQSDADIFLAKYPTSPVKRVMTFTQYDATEGAFGAFYIFETTGGYGKMNEQPFWLTKPSPPPALVPNEHFLPNIIAHTGTTEEWTLTNATGEVHAFHIHQLTFVTYFNPLEGGAVHVRQDVVAIPAAIMDPAKPQNGNFPWLKPQSVKIKMDFTNAQKGVYVYHCHMLFHEDRGMMGIIQVI